MAPKTTPKKGTPKKAASGPKKPTLYQLFMKKELKTVKAANPKLSQKEVFAQVAKNWKTAPENPKKGK